MRKRSRAGIEGTAGLKTKITADMPGSQTDQDTIYTYGVTKGASAGDSEIGNKDLLHIDRAHPCGRHSRILRFCAQSRPFDVRGSTHLYAATLTLFLWHAPDVTALRSRRIPDAPGVNLGVTQK